MNVLIEKGTNLGVVTSIREVFQTLGFQHDFMELTFKTPQVSLQELDKALQKEFKGKNLVITSRRIDGKRQLGLNFDYYGVANKLNGTLAVVTLNHQTNSKIGFVALHEFLHLLGLKHCNSHGCVMAFKLCNHQLQYCLTCSHPCHNTVLCKKCRGEVNA